MLIREDCLNVLSSLSSESVDLIYLDPPFFTQKTQSLTSRDISEAYEFNDTWDSISDYINYLKPRIQECKRVLKNTGSLFLHCDKYASHHLRILLDDVFRPDNFRSEIIWAYRRWSNSKKGLLNGHQTIYFYSKSEDFKFNTIYTEYSPTTNVDQILQERVRNEHGKSTYKRDNLGNVVLGKEKKGVPLSDVWSIPYLNPKAKERCGYPTQKPVLLLEQILRIASDEGDTVLDPFCGSGTTLVAASLLNRNYIGIDISEPAIQLCEKRLEIPTKTTSFLLEKGEEQYISKTEFELSILTSIDAVPVQRNSGIDGFLKQTYLGKPVAVKIQKPDEDIWEAKAKLMKQSKRKGCLFSILIRTHKNDQVLFSALELSNHADNVLVIDSYDVTISKLLTDQSESVTTLDHNIVG
ncbi:site-specific DNA-methyltransferase [Paradesulfitobacterium aromaticivorans]